MLSSFSRSSKSPKISKLPHSDISKQFCKSLNHWFIYVARKARFGCHPVIHRFTSSRRSPNPVKRPSSTQPSYNSISAFSHRASARDLRADFRQRQYPTAGRDGASWKRRMAAGAPKAGLPTMREREAKMAIRPDGEASRERSRDSRGFRAML